MVAARVPHLVQYRSVGVSGLLQLLHDVTDKARSLMFVRGERAAKMCSFPLRSKHLCEIHAAAEYIGILSSCV